MRIGTNHGSLSDRIMSRYGDTANGMVESAMEFCRIARSLDYHQIILSMKSSNPQVMVHAYRLLLQQMQHEFGECYPLHLGVTEAGDGEDGRIKSAIGIGTLLEDGIGDTIRVSLTEDPELEIPVCRDIVKRYNGQASNLEAASILPIDKLPYNPFEYKRRPTKEVLNIGAGQVPVVIADLSHLAFISRDSLLAVGYTYNADIDKWSIGDAAADYVFIGNKTIDFDLPGTLRIISSNTNLTSGTEQNKYFPIFNVDDFMTSDHKNTSLNFVMIDCYSTASQIADEQLLKIAKNPTVVFCLSSKLQHAMPAVRRMFVKLMELGIDAPVILMTDSSNQTTDEHLIHFATETGALLLDGFGDGICLGVTENVYIESAGKMSNLSGRNYLSNSTIEQFLNATSFGILQATRTRISKTEYISCPSCGRTLFELQETTAKIRKVTNHLKGLKIAIMGCIVNGPGEMADADFGYVGSGIGKITLYKGKEIMKRNIDSEVAVDELIQLLKEHGAWIEK
jgi:(E)-4-hydroxy-3-methylbut-2-enyl-diphosphate synthase